MAEWEKDRETVCAKERQGRSFTTSISMAIAIQQSAYALEEDRREFLFPDAQRTLRNVNFPDVIALFYTQWKFSCLSWKTDEQWERQRSFRCLYCTYGTSDISDFSSPRWANMRMEVTTRLSGGSWTLLLYMRICVCTLCFVDTPLITHVWSDNSYANYMFLPSIIVILLI